MFAPTFNLCTETHIIITISERSMAGLGVLLDALHVIVGFPVRTFMSQLYRCVAAMGMISWGEIYNTTL